MTAFETQALASMKTQYLAWVDAGCPVQWQINGRSKSIADMQRIFDRINELELKSNRDSQGSFYASEFRRPE